MHKQLEEYLAEVEKNLSSLPIARRNDEIKEMRQHLLSAVALHQERGQSEDQAVANVLQQFGGQKALGKKVVSAWRREVWKRTMGGPPEVILFAIFSAVVTVSDFWLTFAGPKLWCEAVFPYTGGSLSLPYLFSLPSAFQMIFAPGIDSKARRGPIALLFLCAAFGLGDYLWMSHLENFHNPYLTVNSWQPVLTVALPLAWVTALLVCPAVRSRKARQPAA